MFRMSQGGEKSEMADNIKAPIEVATNVDNPDDASRRSEFTSPVSQVQPVRIQMLGESGVGKTCFLAGLALLNEQTGGRSFVLPTDDKTKAVFDKLRETLVRGRWPAKTSIVEELSFVIVRGASHVGVHLNDFAGESFTDSMKRGNATEAANQIKSLVSGADVLMVLLDGAAIDRGDEFAGAPLIQAVFERILAVGRGNLDAAVVLTKSDLCKSIPMTTSSDLKQAVESRAPDLARFLQEQSIPTEWIPISVCGPNAIDDSGSPIYQALSPQGYERIFEQLFRRSRRPRNRLRKQIIAAIVLILFMGFAWTVLRSRQVVSQRSQIEDPTIPIVEVSGPVEATNEPLVRERYAEDFAKAKKDIEASGNVESIALVLKRFERIPPVHDQLVRGGLEQLKSQASIRKEQLLHKLVIDCQQLRTGDCVPLISKYLSEFPDGPNADELRKILKDINQARYLTARGNVKAVPVTSIEALHQKISAIKKFLDENGQFLSAEEKEAIASARDIALQFVTSRQYQCKLVRTSGLDGPRDHGVEIDLDQKKIANFNDSGDVSEKNWDRSFTVDWKSGQSIKVKLVNYDGFNHDIAYFEDSSPVAIILLAKTNLPNRYFEGMLFSENFTKTRPSIKVAFKCQELPNEKLQLISGYLLPGDKW